MYAYTSIVRNGGEKDENGEAIDPGAAAHQDEARCNADSGLHSERLYSDAAGAGTHSYIKGKAEREVKHGTQRAR